MSKSKQYFIGFTLLELLVVITVIGILSSLLIPALMSAKAKVYQARCKNKFHQIGTSMMLYLDRHGRTVLYPDENGAPFLTKLYTTEILTETPVLLCPATLDTNEDGKLIPSITTGDTNNYCSYAGRKNKNPDQFRYPGIFTTKNSTQTSIAADDFELLNNAGFGGNCLANQGTPNHEQEYNFLFLDGHVDGYNTKTDAEYNFLRDPLDN